MNARLAIAALVLTACAPGLRAERGPAPSEPPRPALQVVVFNSPTCGGGCLEVHKALPTRVAPFGDRVRVVEHRLDEEDLFDLFYAYDDHYQSAASAPPVIYVGGEFLNGAEAILNGLAPAIERQLAAGAITWTPAEPPADEIQQRFRALDVAAVAGAGLLDGINPCAFTTIVFLFSMLAYLGKNRREILAVGVGFAAATFATYFLLGLGMLTAIKTFSVQSGLSKGITIGVGVLVLALAGWSLIDYIRFRRSGQAASMSLGLPKSVKLRIHRVIRNGLTTRNLLFGAVTIGVLVALLESLCTGQVYVPTFVYVSRVPELRVHAIGYLLLYNLMFILPLVVVIGLALFGVRSDTLGKLFRRRVGLMKLAMALLFAALGTLVLATV